MAEGADEKSVDEQELERLAVESLLEDVRRRKSRVERVGTMGWVKERSVNKRFLNSLVLQTVPRRQQVAGKADRRERSRDNEPVIRGEGRHTQDHRSVDDGRESGLSDTKRRTRIEEEQSKDEKHDYRRGKDDYKHSSYRKEHSSYHRTREKPRDKGSLEHSRRNYSTTKS
ncbi:Protein POLR1D, isoform 2 [Geodia barretti]|uniref:Protein POLR1D, isoform 2 n=1 Tax=Geodia barretti TaxID=519541 RepID=A0AA35X3V4_GEOBA|nr:Protein POLR1D, isoform 2 [Geodia barretti]